MKKNETVLRISGILALVIISCVIAGCMTSQPPTTSVTMTAKNVTGSTITFTNNDIQPSFIVINPGTTITVMNQDTVSHLLASDTSAPASFKTDKIPPGGSYNFTLKESGFYTFRCTLTTRPAVNIIVN